ncbi:MAG: flagellar hook-basal body complex protein FliE [Bacillus sp. (in: Bacteria)]|uniref:Flagellar hook-basal body complex protein FliE n=1 Tax=Paenibacillus aquistagni TaxID=1852522 RepID=A0A1X7IME0_9BACL|nr:flagellar hook-basal body complex protein FliE [Paenibacillus aquistagni]MBR3379584.1 flagellar hook-basal body complex protein FliE [Bacillus sp. (in: firmicutes)]SMG16083.1 flagellar hook-basal body complex protein FliE [Paenibacillus aquistagni]
MILNSTLPVETSNLASAATSIKRTPSEVTQSFSSFLSDAISQVDAQEKQAQALNTKFMLGEVNVDELMVASERALLSLQLTTQVRNKAIEAYQEIMRIQM